MVLAVLGLVILDPSFNRPSPHSEHTVVGGGGGGDTMQWFVIPPSQAWISLFHGMCSLSKTATSLERTPCSCSLHFFLFNHGRISSFVGAQKTRSSVCNFADFLFCRVHLNQVHRKFGRKTRRRVKKPSLKNNSPRKNLLNNNPRKRTHKTKKRWVVWTAGFNLKSVFHCFSLIWGGYDMSSCNCS